MSGTEMKNAVLITLVVLVVLFVLYQYDPSLMGLLRSSEGFSDAPVNGSGATSHGNATGTVNKQPPGTSSGKSEKFQNEKAGFVSQPGPGNPQSSKAAGDGFKNQPDEKEKKTNEAFADLSAYEGPAQFGSAEAPAGCYPRDQLTPSELLPKDMNSIWAEQNPMGPGSLKGKNFLSAGALIGVNTVGQSLRNANLQIRSEPPNPQVPISIFNQSTISPDISHRPLEIGA
jgi:hypothetical protein